MQKLPSASDDQFTVAGPMSSPSVPVSVTKADKVVMGIAVRQFAAVYTANEMRALVMAPMVVLLPASGLARVKPVARRAQRRLPTVSVSPRKARWCHRSRRWSKSSRLTLNVTGAAQRAPWTGCR